MPKPLPIDATTLPADLIERVRMRCEHEGECWNWTGPLANRVPVMRLKAAQLPNHHPRADCSYIYLSVRRSLYAFTRGPSANRQASGKIMVARCGNPQCVNPEHILALSRPDAARRMSAHVNHVARAAKIAATKRARYAKLTPEQVDQIRNSDTPARQVGAQMGVNQALVCRIRRGEAWRDFGGAMSQMACALRKAG